MNGQKRNEAYICRLKKAGLRFFNESELLNSSFAQLNKFRAENRRLRKASNRLWQL